MSTSVNTRLTGGSAHDAISIGKQQFTSFQSAMEGYGQTTRWLSPMVDEAGVLIQKDGNYIRNPLQRGLNLYGVRLPGQSLREGLDVAEDATGIGGKLLSEYDIAPGQKFNVYTLDIETTGLHSSSQTREISILHRIAEVDENGNTIYSQGIDPKNITTWNIKTNKMDAGATYEKIGGIEKPISLSETAFKQTENDSTRLASWLEDGGESAETAIREAFQMIMGQGAEKNGLPTRFSLHNNNFDIGFLVENVSRMAKNPETIKVLEDFAERRANDPHFVVDTLTSVGATIDAQVAEQGRILAKVGGINEEHVLKFLNESMVDRSLREKAAFIGYGSAPRSVENTILNTNLLQLMEEQGISSDLLGELQAGTHTGRVDVMMQAFIEESITKGNLKIQRVLTKDQAIEMFGKEHGEQMFDELNAAGFLRSNKDGSVRIFSQFEKYMRRKASRSSALTLTTNVKDVNLLSEAGYKYLADTEEGMRRVSLDIEGSVSHQLKSLGFSDEDVSKLGDTFEGRLRFGKNKFTDVEQFHLTNLPEGVTLPSDFQGKARALIRDTLEEARTGLKNNEITIGSSGKINVNMANDMLDIRMTHLEHTELTQMHAARQAKGLASSIVGTGSEESRFMDSLTHTSQMYRVNGKPLSRTVGYGDVITTEAGEVERIDQYARGVQEFGLPYSDLSPASRVSAIESSRATSGIGQQLWEQEAGMLEASTSIDRVAEAKAARSIANNIGNLEEFGQTYFAGQGKEHLLGMVNELQEIRPYARIPLSGVEKFSTNFIIPSSILGKIQVDEINDLGVKTGDRIAIGSQKYLEQANHTVHYSLPSGSSQEDTVNLVFKHGFSEGAEGVAESEDFVRQTLRLMEQDIPLETWDKGHPIAQLVERMRSNTDPSKNVEVSTGQVRQLIKGGEGLAIPEGASEAYAGLVTELGETLRQSGSVSLSAKGEVGKALKATLEYTRSEAMSNQNTDVELIKTPGRITRWFNDMLGAEVSPMKNEEGAIGVEALDRLTTPPTSSTTTERAAQLAGREMDEAAQSARRVAAQKLEESPDLLRALEIRKATEVGDKFRPFTLRAQKMWGENKGKVAIGAAIIGTALIARHLSKKHRENQQYESTMMMSEPEQGQRPYGAQEALLAPKAPQSNSDPLATAGVVGNLDRRKVGHTNMSPQKNAHLFRG